MYAADVGELQLRLEHDGDARGPIGDPPVDDPSGLHGHPGSSSDRADERTAPTGADGPAPVDELAAFGGVRSPHVADQIRHQRHDRHLFLSTGRVTVDDFIIAYI